MRIKLLVAVKNRDYAEHQSAVISENHADVIDVSVCTTGERLGELLAIQRFDAALFDTELLEGADLRNIQLPMLLWAEEEYAAEPSVELIRVNKYQRVSSIVANVLENYAKVSVNSRCAGSKKAQIIAVWSPAGGVGKTTVALAFTAKRASEGKQVLYLDLEHFSSVPVYFAQTGKSISTVFEMLEAKEGNVNLLVRGIRCKDGAVSYFTRPDNFDDMNILSAENVAVLIDACCELADELVVDMSSVCDERARRVLELSDRVLLVTDPSSTAQAKLSQFISQHSIFARVRGKSTLVANKGAAADMQHVDSAICLPLVQSADAAAVYKTLSLSSFQ